MELVKCIYRNPCSCGSAYIGETGDSVKIRHSKHNFCWRFGHPTQSEGAEHYHQTGNQILFDKISVVDRCPHLCISKISESIELSEHIENFNRDDG